MVRCIRTIFFQISFLLTIFNTAQAKEPIVVTIPPHVIEHENIEVEYFGLDPDQRYWVILLDPRIHSGDSGNFFQAKKVEGSTQKKIRFSGIPSGDYILRLVDGNSEYRWVKLKEVKLQVMEVASNNSCSNIIMIEDAGECLKRDLVRVASTRKKTNLKAIEDLYESFTARPLRAMNCKWAKGILNDALDSVGLEIAEKYPRNEMLECPASLAVLSHIVGFDREFPECRKWELPASLKPCFDSIVKRYGNDAILGASHEFLQTYFRGKDLKIKGRTVNVVRDSTRNKLRNLVRVAFDKDVNSCWSWRTFDKTGFILQVKSYRNVGGNSTLHISHLDICQTIMELAYENNYLTEEKINEWKAAQKKGAEERRARADAQARKMEQDNVRNARLMERLREVEAQKKAYLASNEGIIGTAAAKEYNQTILKGICLENRLGLLGINLGRGTSMGALSEIIYADEACKLRLITTSSATFYAANSLVTNCKNGWCDIEILIACDFRGFIMAESCATIKSARPRGRVQYDEPGVFAKLVLN